MTFAKPLGIFATLVGVLWSVPFFSLYLTGRFDCRWIASVLVVLSGPTLLLAGSVLIDAADEIATLKSAASERRKSDR